MNSLMIKNLTKELLKNRIFLLLLLVMTVATSFMFYFIRFSIDANMAHLLSLGALDANHQNYMAALKANTPLATMFLIIITSVTALTFVMFYFRFFSGAKKQFGLYKALGAKNIDIQLFFTVFVTVFSLVGLLIGMLAGYFGSSVHIAANSSTYDVTDLVKGVNFAGVLLGLGLPLLSFAITAFVCGFKLYRTQNGSLLSDAKPVQTQPRVLAFADVCVKHLPIQNKAPLRIAMRKPIPILLILIASTVFTVMLVLGWSLTQSSETLCQMQTDGHNYMFECTFDSIQADTVGGLRYVSVDGYLHSDNGEVFEYDDEDERIVQSLFGMDEEDGIYDIKAVGGESLGLPSDGECFVSLGTAEMYGIQKGHVVVITTDSGDFALTVADIAYNAKTKTVIVSREYLCGELGLETNSFNGVLTLENIYPNASKVVDNEERQDALTREKVSGNTSAILNQSIGVASGVVLIFLALLLAFQDSVKDMLIMDSLGYTKRDIKKLLINVFLPILILGFVIMAFPSVLIARSVQTSLAMQMGDYLPFSTNFLVLAVGLVAITAVYWLVQQIFTLGIKRITKTKGILEYTNTL